MAHVAVQFSPHPDDEVIGAPGAIFALRDAGWRIVNVACSLGRTEQRERRRAELGEACRRAGFELRLEDVAPGQVLAELTPDLVITPSPHDRHPFHEQVARDVLATVAKAKAPATVWLSSIWGDSPLPTLAVELTAARLDEIEHALAAHEGEIERSDFPRYLRARAAVNGVLGAERIFGYGSPALPFENAELLTELKLVEGRWLLAEPRILDSREVDEQGRASATDLTEWLFEASVTARFGSRHA